MAVDHSSTPSDKELEQWLRERQEKRNPGHSRRKREHDAKMFNAWAKKIKEDIKNGR